MPPIVLETLQSLKDYVGREINKMLVRIQRTIEVKKKAANIKSGFFISGITSLAEGASQ